MTKEQIKPLFNLVQRYIMFEMEPATFGFGDCAHRIIFVDVD